MNLKTSSEVETRALLDEICSFDRKGLFDLGHPLLNRIAESFVKAAGIGAVQAVSREAYFTAIDGNAYFLNLYIYIILSIFLFTTGICWYMFLSTNTLWTRRVLCRSCSTRH